MPPRLERRQKTGDIHFITFSCHGRNPYLSTPESKAVFERVLERTRITHRFHIHGYVVMPEHVHLLLTEPPDLPLSTIIQILKRSVSIQLKEKPFWLRRYHDFNVFTSEKLQEKLRYLHRNPVARGLTDSPGSYPWSSFQNYQEPGAPRAVKVHIH